VEWGENQKKTAKLMGLDKDSLTGQQREIKITTIILIKRIYRVQFSHCLMLSSLPWPAPPPKHRA